MQMDQSEYLALRETLPETRTMATELGITLTEALLLRQLVCIRWLCNEEANEPKKK